MAVRPLPRLRLATLPTPLVRAERLEAALGRDLDCPPIWIKRDDLTGFALAGNKARKLEFLVADARERGCDVLLTGGGPGSNHCQATAAAAAATGFGCRIVYYGTEPSTPPPNLRLARMVGAEVVFTGDPERSSVDARLEEEAEALRAEGRSPSVIPRGGATSVGSVGYALAARELSEQLVAVGVEPALVLLATGSCGTQAGLVAGTVELGRPWRVVGASVSRPPEECLERVLRIAMGCADLLGTPPPGPDDIDLRDARGPGYGVASAEGASAAALLARTEGLYLDPVFTAKAMAALLDIVHAGSPGPMVFVHTGGLAALLGEKGEA